MAFSYLEDILNTPHQNGITLFITGGLCILSVYHFLLYFQHKDRSYLFYSLYTFLLFTRNIVDVENSFINEITGLQSLLDKISYYKINLEWAYNSVYFVFAFTFVDLKSFSKKWYKIIFYAVGLLFLLNVAIELSYLVTANKQIYPVAFKFMIGILTCLSIVGYIPLFQIKGFLKYYIICGSLILLVASICAYIISYWGLQKPNSDLNISIFYIGLIFENIFFTLGLGHKQKIVLQDKNRAQERLIKQLRENEYLRNKEQIKLVESVESLSQQSENEKIEKIKATYDKQLAELKITALKSQMNPHFIFNSLNSIKLYIINNEKENAVYYLNKFSKLIRKILDSTREKEISLSEEIETMELYVSIENIRFSNSIEFLLDIDPDIQMETIKIPPLILQPFIENAIWHGLSAKDRNKNLFLRIQKKQEEYIKVIVEDNGIGRLKSAELNAKKLREKNSIGIDLTKERLSNFTKDFRYSHSLEIIDLYKNELPVGTKVILTLPLI